MDRCWTSMKEVRKAPFVSDWKRKQSESVMRNENEYCLKKSKESERKESERKESERKESERKESERKESERKESERKESERKESERNLFLRL